MVTIACELFRKHDPGFSACAAIRHEVFIVEQHVPPEEEMDELDDAALHALATLDGSPVGTGRIILHDDRTAKIGRMAVRAAFRRRGVGAAVLARLLDAARAAGAETVSLAAQLHAIPFYARFGFVAYGDIFVDACIDHRMMVLSLA